MTRTFPAEDTLVIQRINPTIQCLQNLLNKHMILN